MINPDQFFCDGDEVIGIMGGSSRGCQQQGIQVKVLNTETEITQFDAPRPQLRADVARIIVPRTVCPITELEDKDAQRFFKKGV
jgi:hypothetical protein